MSAALRLHLPHSRAFTFTSSPSTRRVFRRSSVLNRCLCQGTLLRSCASARPPSNPLGRRCARTRAPRCVYVHISGRVTGYPALSRNAYESRAASRKRAPSSPGLRTSTLRLSCAAVPGAASRLHNARACRERLIGGWALRENARERSFVPLIADGSRGGATSRKIQGHDPRSSAIACTRCRASRPASRIWMGNCVSLFWTFP